MCYLFAVIFTPMYPHVFPSFFFFSFPQKQKNIQGKNVCSVHLGEQPAREVEGEERNLLRGVGTTSAGSTEHRPGQNRLL